jgi:hypothetical protein
MENVYSRSSLITGLWLADLIFYVTFQAFTAVKIKVIFWVVAPCNVGYQCVRGPCCGMGAAGSYETLVSHHNTAQHHNPGDLNLIIQKIFLGIAHLS